MNNQQISQWISHLIQPYSIEIQPKLTEKIPSFDPYVSSQTPVFITFIPGTSYTETAQAGAELKRQGLRPVPHIGARSLHSEAELKDFLARLQQAGVDEVLLIGGSVDRPKGPYAETLPILESGILEDHGMKTIYVGGHPEGNQGIRQAELDEVLKRKNKLAQSSSAQYEMVTQFAFKAQPIIEWEKRIRAFNELPIRVGLAGPAKLKNLIHFAKLSGVGASLKALTANPLNYFRLATTSTPAPIITEIAQSVAHDSDSKIHAFHFYTFGGFKRTSHWLNAIAQGDYRFKRFGRGFELTESF